MYTIHSYIIKSILCKEKKKRAIKLSVHYHNYGATKGTTCLHGSRKRLKFLQLLPWLRPVKQELVQESLYITLVLFILKKPLGSKINTIKYWANSKPYFAF